MTEQLGLRPGQSKPHCPDIDIIGKLAKSLASFLYSDLFIIYLFISGIAPFA